MDGSGVSHNIFSSICPSRVYGSNIVNDAATSPSLLLVPDSLLLNTGVLGTCLSFLIEHEWMTAPSSCAIVAVRRQEGVPPASTRHALCSRLAGQVQGLQSKEAQRLRTVRIMEPDGATLRGPQPPFKGAQSPVPLSVLMRPGPHTG